MIISLIVAASENNVIGNSGKLPWSLPNDLKYFRDLTVGKPVIMGRKTLESIGKPLPGRQNIVITSQNTLPLPGCDTADSPARALEKAEESGAKEVFVIGGGQIFHDLLPLANRVYLTRVHATIEGDTFFPKLDQAAWTEISRERHPADPKHLHDYTFFVYERRK